MSEAASKWAAKTKESTDRVRCSSVPVASRDVLVAWLVGCSLLMLFLFTSTCKRSKTHSARSCAVSGYLGLHTLVPNFRLEAARAAVEVPGWLYCCWAVYGDRLRR